MKEEIFSIHKITCVFVNQEQIFSQLSISRPSLLHKGDAIKYRYNS